MWPRHPRYRDPHTKYRSISPLSCAGNCESLESAKCSKKLGCRESLSIKSRSFKPGIGEAGSCLSPCTSTATGAMLLLLGIAAEASLTEAGPSSDIILGEDAIEETNID